MKKTILFTFVLLCSTLFSMGASAQISRNVYGINIGTTTANAKQILINKGLDVSTKKSDSGYAVSAESVSFGGILWDKCIVSASTDNKVYEVGFVYFSYDYESLSKKALTLLGNLTTKYKEYGYASDSEDLSDGGISIFQSFSDGKTIITMTAEIHQYAQSSIVLYYIDKAAFDKRQNSEISDL